MVKWQYGKSSQPALLHHPHGPSESGPSNICCRLSFTPRGKVLNVYKEGKSFKMLGRVLPVCPLQVGKGVSGLGEEMHL